MHLATMGGRSEVVAQLLKAGASVDATDLKGNTPAHLGAKNNQVHALVSLMEHAAPLRARNHRDGMMPLHMAAIYGSADATDLLAHSGARLH